MSASRHLGRSAAISAILLCAVGAAGTTAARGGEDPIEHYRKAMEAHGNKDYEGYRDGMEKAVALAPDYPALIYRLGAANALVGRKDEALRALRRLVEMRIHRDLESDPDLASIAATPEFASLLARMRDATAPVGTSQPAFQLPWKDFIPEGIAWDPVGARFYVGSVHRRMIARVGPGGRVRRFVREGRGDLGAVLGLAVDPARRLLWACSSALPQMRGGRADEPDRAWLHSYDLRRGRRTGSWPLGSGEPGHNCNDLAVDPGGAVFVSDAAAGAILRLAPGSASLEIFLGEGTFRSPQGLAFDAGGDRMFVADYSRGIFSVDIANREVRRLDHPLDMTPRGVDGLSWHGGGLIAIQNGITPHRVVRFDLDASATRIDRATILEMGNPLFDEPTLGVVVDDDLYYVANSHWGRFGEDGAIASPETLAEPQVLRLDLRGR